MLLLEIIILVFICKRNGQLALQKGLKPITWKLLTIVAWLLAESIGYVTGILMIIKMPVTDIKQIPPTDLLMLSVTALFFAFGGYLLIRYILENKPDVEEKKVNNIEIEDLRPPQKND